jgi:N-acetylglucosaminyldiphosphoundecaprenol N-acetyl-beta-D-mannosaminyltransferase
MRTKFLNYNIDNLTLDETVDKVIELINNGRTNQHVVLNAAKIAMMEDDKELADIVNSCDLINADGISIIFASWFLGNKIKERVTGIDLMLRLFEVADRKGYRVYLLGAREEIIQKVVKILKKEHKGLEIAGYRNGYFDENEEPEIIREINNSKCHILFVGTSTPKKEFFLNKYKDILEVPFCMGVGGSFDVVAGGKQRAPQWVQRIGCEWLYRFFQEPRRLWKRYSILNFKFIFIVLRYLILKR